ncbi:hypothetical protein K470DRAFT_273098 [Piedraia hortae CBS 480.64]|uniref:Uncharacterized protein n=1 Tax=Piedraia hortae CBS 480.64 TaxID=1314780 RepID=A0A6A7BRZ4_9PEZI|nr:hypothetical protein K470DRAFT_273098 [Piedraia hortae CBS 480.64]
MAPPTVSKQAYDILAEEAEHWYAEWGHLQEKRTDLENQLREATKSSKRADLLQGERDDLLLELAAKNDELVQEKTRALRAQEALRDAERMYRQHSLRADYNAEEAVRLLKKLDSLGELLHEGHEEREKMQEDLEALRRKFERARAERNEAVERLKVAVRRGRALNASRNERAEPEEAQGNFQTTFTWETRDGLKLQDGGDVERLCRQVMRFIWG